MSLVTRIQAFIAAIGVDIKTHASEINVLKSKVPQGVVYQTTTGIIASDAQPVDPVPGMVWVDLFDGTEYTYFLDVNGGHWVEL